MGDSCVARRMLRYSAIQGSRCLLAALAAGVVGVVLANPLAELVDPAAELLERLDHRLDPLRAQTEFLDQPDGAAAAASQPPPRRPALGRVARLAGGDVVVAPVPLQQRLQRAQIVRQPAENLVLLELIGHRDLHGAVERQLAVVHAPQHLDRRLHHVVALQHLVAEPGAGDLDLLGQRDFLLPGQQRNLAHLRQVHAHRIVGPRFVVLDPGQQVVGAHVQLRDRALRRRPRRPGPNRLQRPTPRPDRRPDPASLPPERSVRLPGRPTVRRTKCYSSGQSIRSCVCSPAPDTTLSYERRPKAKKFYHRIPAPQPIRRHLAKDSACGENSLARSKNPNRSRIRKAASVRVQPINLHTIERPKPDSSTSTGHQIVRWLIPRLRFPSCRKPGIHLCARRHYDAHTVTARLHSIHCNHSIWSVQYFWPKIHRTFTRPYLPTMNVNIG